MAVTGTFLANFDAFHSAVDTSTAKLRSMEAESDKVGVSVSKIGGVAPPNFRQLGAGATQAGNAFSGAAQSIREVDNVLNLVGLHTGPAGKALSDLGNAAGAGAGQLGQLGEAGLVLGAAIGGWQVGRAIADFAGLDEKIGTVTASLLGLPSAAEQAAAATVDAIARAQGKIQGLVVTTAETARAINKAEAEAAIARNKTLSDMNDRLAAVAHVDAQIQKITDEIATFSQSGLVNDLTRQINAHAVSLKDLGEQYHLSDAAMNQFAADAARIASVGAANTKKLEDTERALLDARRAREQQGIDAAKKAQDAMLAQIAADTAATAAKHQKDIAELDAQTAAYNATVKETQALRDQAGAAQEVSRAIGSTIDYGDLSKPENLDYFRRMNPGATISAAATPQYFATHTLADAVRQGLVSFGGTGIFSSSYTGPSGTPAGAVSVVNASINVSGVMDATTSVSLATAVAEQITASIKRGRH